ncbi:hypothetical protein [Deinococcus sp.]|uniref:hypothetical protein n=1 Tax=Deinococcus sp. TaxID=47478 RepID=UPI0025C5B172|nr:hypothetical protein [Deinococcus sp.]
MQDADLHAILQNLADWGGCELNDFNTTFGESNLNVIKRRHYVEQIDTPYGKILYLTRDGRLAVGLTNLYHPTVQALVNNVAVRRAVAALTAEGYTDPKPRVYGNAHAQMTDPDGKLVCVSARATSFNSHSIRLLAGRLFDGTRPELSRLFVFVPRAKRFRTLHDRYPLEIREVDMPQPLQVKVPAASRGRKKAAADV